jgi:hypothetical protein
MSIKRRPLIALVATMVSFHAYAEPKTGNELLSQCLAQDAMSVVCVAYVRGVVDTMQIIGGMCIPDVVIGQVRDVGIRYLIAHPESRQRAAMLLLSAAIKEAWPCSHDRAPPPTPRPTPR